ncbi:MAG: preprotein translocase subunit SecG [Acidobacteriaceae bacterium]
MIYLFTVIHVVVCFVLIGIILLQPGTGADLAGAFGGQGSQTAFGPRGTVSLLTKVTTWLAVIFAITSIGLTVMVSHEGSSHSVLSGVPAQTTSTPAKHK